MNAKLTVASGIDGVADGRAVTKCLPPTDSLRLAMAVGLGVNDAIFTARTDQRRGRAFRVDLPCPPSRPARKGYRRPIDGFVPVPLKDLESTVAGRVEGSAIEVVALRADAETGHLEIAEIRDNSLALRAISANSVHRMVLAAEFRPWPQLTVHIGGQPSVYQWTGGHARCAKCGGELEHFAYVGTSGGDVRERGQGSARPISYCERCAHSPF